MSKKIISRPSCILSIIIFILLVSSTGLLVLMLKGQYSFAPDPSEGGCPVLHPEVSTSGMDVQSDQATSSPDVVLRPWRDFRLPKHVLPLHYDILLHPDLQKDTFEGEVTIEVNVTKETRYFVVHSRQLTFHQTTVEDTGRKSALPLDKWFEYKPNQFLVLEMEEEMKIGIYKLHIEFSGILDTTEINGFYKSWYRNGKDEIRPLATSKFQPDYARRAFPCFDEPSFKSTFSISLVHAKNYFALSNMPVEVTESFSGTDLLITKFQKSVPMVTYLPCFIVCDFLYQEHIMASGKPFRVYSKPGQINSTSYALEVGAKILETFEEYFGIEYQLPKIDLIAIPHYPKSATEHWGLITFAQHRLLYVQEEYTNPLEKQALTAIVAHELAHMWFGNLVTCEWWDDTWLNEGFASYIEYIGVVAAEPDWDMWSQFLSEDMHVGMRLDMHALSVPLVKPATSPEGIKDMFSTIVYKKGASIARMLHLFVGDENFRKGTSAYLKKHQYETVVTNDLWNELANICGQQGGRNFHEVMGTWLNEAGFPFVTVRRKDPNASTFIAKQSMFLKSEEIRLRETNSTSKSIWSIPLSYTTSKGTNGIVWIHDDQETEFSVSDEYSEWVKFNVNQTGYYIVNYDNEEWKKLTDLMMRNHEALTPSDRSNLLFDSFHLAEAGHVGFDVFLSLIMYLKNEMHYVPWDTARKIFDQMNDNLDTNTRNLFKNYLRYLAADLYQALGWNRINHHLENLLRRVVMYTACDSGDPKCRDDASELHTKWENGEPIDNALRFHLRNLIVPPDVNDWNDKWNQYVEVESEITQSENFKQRNRASENQRKRARLFSLRNLGYLEDECKQLTSEDQMTAKFPDWTGKGRVTCLEFIDYASKWKTLYSQNVTTWMELESPVPWYHHRLPSYIVPMHYDLLLRPMLDKDVFNGSVAVIVELQKPSSYFLVHSVDLSVTKVEVTSEENAQTVVLDEVFPYQDHDYLVLKTGTKQPIGRYRLYFEFDGPLTLSLKGLYKSSYVDPEANQQRFLATTQFESINARRAFPCFDEPRFKTTFNVSIVHESHYFALSNTLIQSTIKLENGLLMTRFQKTLPMVTYLLAVVVCDFKFKETTTENGVKLRIYTASHHIEKTNYALDVASRILTYYENYFDIPFPLKKLDLITIPDFTANGMENWGLITFSEESLIGENTSTVETKQHIVNIIGHELAHMWFGDLVTMEWWSDLWLNEGFATYISTIGAKLVEPDLYEGDEKNTGTLMAAMSEDSNLNSHPIVQDVTRVNAAIFDDITYLKGSSVLRMLENYMGEDFRIGVSAYLKKYSFGNAKTEDLWNALSTASKQCLDVSTLMKTWTSQMNYPYLNVQRAENDSHSYVIQQHRYFAMQENVLMSARESLAGWIVPVTYRTSQNSETLYLLLNTSDEKVAISVPESDWIKLNLGFTGFYSVNYDNATWINFIKILETNHTLFSPTDRLSLLHDALAMSEASILEYEVALNLTKYLRAEEYHSAWNIGYEELNRIRRYFREDPVTQEIIGEYIRSLSKDLLKKYTWNDTGSYSERKLRVLLIEAACKSGNQDCLLTARRSFKLWMEGGEISLQTKLYVLKFGLQAYDSSDSWNFVWKRYLEETDPNEKQILLEALTSVENEDILAKLIEYAKDESLVRKHDFVGVMTNIAQNPKGQSLVTRFIFNNWEDLKRKHGVFDVENFAKDIFSLYMTQEDLEKVRTFYKSHPKDKDSGTLRLKAIENINLNINWIKRHQNNVRRWFQNNVDMPWKDPRLPSHIIPTLYNITLRPNMSSMNFEGVVGIELEVAEDTDHILIHQSGLQMSGVEVRSLSPSAVGNVIDIKEEFSYKRNEFYVIRFRAAIQRGLYVLRMKFIGEIAKNDWGIGRYQYTHRITKDERHLLATQFEPTYARKAFPCFDEPAMKAEFQLNIIHDSSLTTLSNMPEESKIKLENDLMKTVFMKSPKMSTYLLFFAVSDFEYLEGDFKGKPVRVYAPPDRLLEAEHGLNATIRILEKLEEYFDLPYALPKLDSIAIPGYVVPGMEHWGSISYNSQNFLVNDTSLKMRMEVDRVIAHELTHQWIGNLVTMKWWDDLWLKEGLSNILIRELNPTANEVNARWMSKMMCIDSILESHPIVRNITTPDEIMKTFNVMSYEKASSVLEMLQNSMKEDFKRGILAYLKKYAYQNTDRKDFWTQISKSTKKEVNVAEMINTWTLQIGFPLVELNRKGRNVTATQKWFIRNANLTAAVEIAKRHNYAPFGLIWKIPLPYKNLENGKEHTLWLNEKNATFQIETDPDDVVKFNPGFIGFYVVNYDHPEWARLGRKLRMNHLDLSVLDRYNILHDAFLLAESGIVSYAIPLQLSRYLEQESASLPWSIFKDHFLKFMRHLDDESSRDLLEKYVHHLTRNLYENHLETINKKYFKNWKSDTGACSFEVPDTDFLYILVEMACRTSNEQCMDTMKEELRLWMNGRNNEVDVQIVLKLGIPHFGETTTWDYLYSEMTSNDEEKYVMAEGLTAFRDPKLVQKTIDVIAADVSIDSEMASYLFQKLADNFESLPILWGFVKHNWNTLKNRLVTPNKPFFALSYLCEKFKTAEQLNELIQFLEQVPDASKFDMESCRRKIQEAIHWSETFQEDISTWLNWNVNK